MKKKSTTSKKIKKKLPKYKEAGYTITGGFDYNPQPAPANTSLSGSGVGLGNTNNQGAGGSNFDWSQVGKFASGLTNASTQTGQQPNMTSGDKVAGSVQAVGDQAAGFIPGFGAFYGLAKGVAQGIDAATPETTYTDREGKTYSAEKDRYTDVQSTMFNDVFSIGTEKLGTTVDEWGENSAGQNAKNVLATFGSITGLTYPFEGLMAAKQGDEDRAELKEAMRKGYIQDRKDEGTWYSSEGPIYAKEGGMVAYNDAGNVFGNLEILDQDSKFKKVGNARRILKAAGKSHTKGGIPGDTDGDGKADIEFEGGEGVIKTADGGVYMVNKKLMKKYEPFLNKLTTGKKAEASEQAIIDKLIAENDKNLDEKGLQNRMSDYMKQGGNVPKYTPGGYLNPLEQNLFNQMYLSNAPEPVDAYGIQFGTNSALTTPPSNAEIVTPKPAYKRDGSITGEDLRYDPNYKTPTVFDVPDEVDPDGLNKKKSTSTTDIQPSTPYGREGYTAGELAAWGSLLSKTLQDKFQLASIKPELVNYDHISKGLEAGQQRAEQMYGKGLTTELQKNNLNYNAARQGLRDAVPQYSNYAANQRNLYTAKQQGDAAAIRDMYDKKAGMFSTHANQLANLRSQLQTTQDQINTQEKDAIDSLKFQTRQNNFNNSMSAVNLMHGRRYRKDQLNAPNYVDYNSDTGQVTLDNYRYKKDANGNLIRVR